MDAEKLITLLKKVLLKEADSREQEELNRILSEDESLAGISAEFISEQQNEDQPEPEGRHGYAGEDREGDELVGPTELADRRDDTCEKTDDRAEDERHAGKDKRRLEPFQHLVEDRTIERKGATEVSLEDIPDPDEVLLH